MEKTQSILVRHPWSSGMKKSKENPEYRIRKKYAGLSDPLVVFRTGEED